MEQLSHEPQKVLEKTSTAEELRAQRVWLLIRVGWLTFAFFCAFCCMRGYYDAGLVCFSQVLVVGLILRASRGTKNYELIMNLSLASCGTGLFLAASVESAMSLAMFFFPISIFIASYLIGIRAATHWLFATIFANTLFYWPSDCIVSFFSTVQFDQMALANSVALCIYGCCHQAEASHTERTQTLVDLSEKLQEKADHLHNLATTDSLTGLLNRFQFQKELDRQVQLANDHDGVVTLVMIDMDGFKEINDTLGHPIGDEALISVGERLEREFKDRFSIARLGGDEFCLICPGVGTTEEAIEVCERTRATLTKRYVLDECDFPLGASVGSAMCPVDTDSATELLAYADTAMFHAKENQLGVATYQASMTDRLVEYRAMQEKLSGALERDEFLLVYQPQVALESDEIIGVEALLRWRIDGEIVSPARFIPLLEKSRGIVPVGRWIIRECCRQLSEWNDLGIDIELSLNLSSVQFGDEELYCHVVSCIDEFEIDPNHLDFEITESLLVNDVERAVSRLEEFKEAGVRISIDDFGTGYSSLAYLQQFPIDRLKIDRAFVKDIPDNDDGVIASSIVALGKALGLKVLAEGVETKEQREFLLSLDCDEYQGYYFSRPVAPTEIVQLIRGHNAMECH